MSRTIRKSKNVVKFGDVKCRRIFEEYDHVKFTRDGNCNSTQHNKFFKYLCKTYHKAETRKLESKIVKDDDYDHLSYPARKNGKTFIWSV